MLRLDGHGAGSGPLAPGTAWVRHKRRHGRPRGRRRRRPADPVAPGARRPAQTHASVHAAPLLPLHRSQRLTDTWPYVTGTVAAGLVPHALRQHRRVRDVARQVADYDVPLSCDAFQVLISARLPRTFLSLRSVYMGVYEVQVTDWGTYRTRRVAQALWKAVYGRLDAAVQLALARRPLPSCPPTAPDAVRARAAAAADRRFWSDFKLFQCILAWHPWVVREALEGLACRVLLPRLLLPALRADAFDRADLVRYERVRAPTAHRAAVHYNALTLAPAAVPLPPPPLRWWRPSRPNGSRGLTRRSSCSRWCSNCTRQRPMPPLPQPTGRSQPCTPALQARQRESVCVLTVGRWAGS
jgi:hypothetical protein